MGVFRRQFVLVSGLIVALAAGVLQLSGAQSDVASAATAPAITWLAAGDSYASGQGLPHPSAPCAQGTGKNGSGSTWAVAAANLLREQGFNIAEGRPDLVACTGAISDQFFHADGASADKEPQWKSSMKRYDLVTFSFGGDDIQFKSTITQCTLAIHLCAPANTERNKITELGSTGDYVLGIHEPGFPTFLNHVATAAVVKGGNVIVMGYPLVFEKPSGWDKALLRTCSGFTPAILDRMRGWGSDLNATIGESVAKVNAESASERNGVHFTFINPVTGGGAISSSDQNLFEPAGSTHHELCSAGHQPWINGFSASHATHSYHPNQDGETAMGNLAAEVITGMYSCLSWATCSSLAITPTSLGGVQLGMSSSDAEAAAGESLPDVGDGLWAPISSSAGGTYLEGSGNPVGCLQAQGRAGSVPRVATLQGVTLGDTVAQLLNVYGSAAHYHPANPSGGYDPVPGYVVTTPTGDLSFWVNDGRINSIATGSEASSGEEICDSGTIGSTTTSSSATSQEPVLGSPSIASQTGAVGDCTGYGEIRPPNFQGCGDPTSVLSNIRWQSWGGAQATGTGTALYIGPNQAVADGIEQQANVVAYDLGSCPDGTYAYQEIEWYFPKEGQSFDPESPSYDTCFGPGSPQGGGMQDNTGSGNTGSGNTGSGNTGSGNTP